MFLIRSIFWLSVVVMLMPASSDGGEAPRVTVFRAMIAARALVSDVGSVCHRNPAACATGGEALALTGKKAETLASIAAAAWSAGRSVGRNVAPEQHGSLTKADLQAPWSAPET